jgi:hypothetical protein
MADPPQKIPRPTATGQSPLAETLLEVSMQSSFVGPLPPPGLLKGYEDVCPGSAQRIIAMAETQSAHRSQIEVKMSDANVEEMRLGIGISAIIRAFLRKGEPAEGKKTTATTQVPVASPKKRKR